MKFGEATDDSQWMSSASHPSTGSLVRTRDKHAVVESRG